MNKNIKETTILTNLMQELSNRGIEITLVQAIWGFEAGIAAIAKLAGLRKNKEQKSAVVLNDENGNFVIGGIVEYHEGADENETGNSNWSFELTYNKEDIEGCIEVEIYGNKTFFKILSDEIHNKYSYFMAMHEDVQKLLFKFLVTSFEIINMYLDRNASEKEEVTVTCDGYFETSVTVENGEKIFTITPAGETKVLVKDDSAIETN